MATLLVKLLNDIIEEQKQRIEELTAARDEFIEANKQLKTELKNLPMQDIVWLSEQFICKKCGSEWGEIRKICFNCENEEEVSK